MFKITIVNDKFHAEITPACALYFSNLNQAKWLAEIEQYCSDLDIFYADEKGTIEGLCWDDALPLSKHACYLDSVPNILGPYVK